MKKIITTVSSMGLTLSSGSAESINDNINVVNNNDLYILYANEESFKGSGFVDLNVEKTVVWTSDNDDSGDVTVGDELTYSVSILNLESTVANNIELFDLLDNKIALNLNTVTITQGVVLSGNGDNDSQNFVDVDFGNISANSFAEVNFDVTITDLEPGLNVISNSAEVYGPLNTIFLSDDPSTPAHDATLIDAFGGLPEIIYSNGFEIKTK